MSQIQAKIGEKLGSYRIESVLGSGAMGVVYKGTDEKRGRPAAVKVVSGEISQGDKIQKRFEREAEILQQFRHPGIVRFLAWGRYRGTWYIAMEFVQGTTLEKILNESGPLPWREALHLMIQICDALHYAHERGVVHRDLKPSNLMITEDRTVKLTDFGIAKDLDAESLTGTGRTLGTAAYMAPEQIRGTPAISHKTDLYALGVVLYQMLVGRAPFEGSSPVVLMHCHLNEDPPRPSARVQEIPRALDDLVVTLMAKSPTDRPWDAAAVELILTTLRDKADKGEPIPMVWPSAGAAGKSSPRGALADSAIGGPAGATAPTTRPKKKARKGTILSTLTGSTFSTRSRSTRDDTDGLASRLAALETPILVAALLGIGGLIAYFVWPPGQDYLYHQAETLMASNRRSDWIRAREEYLDPLDRRFPQNPYRDQSARWRDKILLDEAEGRAQYLTAAVRLRSFSEPKTNAERQFVLAHDLVTVDTERFDDLKAIEHWTQLADRLKPNEPEDRPWYLLALDRVDKLKRAMEDRRRIVEEQLRIANEELRAGRTESAKSIVSQLAERYGRYPDLKDLLPVAPAPDKPAGSPAPEKSEPAAAPDPRPATSPDSPAPAAAGDRARPATSEFRS